MQLDLHSIVSSDIEVGKDVQVVVDIVTELPKGSVVKLVKRDLWTEPNSSTQLNILIIVGKLEVLAIDTGFILILRELILLVIIVLVIVIIKLVMSIVVGLESVLISLINNVVIAT